MGYSGLILDLDGTLLDTLGDLASATNQALETLGYATHPTDAYRIFVGDGVRSLAERALPVDARTADTIDACVKAIRRGYDGSWNGLTAPYPGVESMLDELCGLNCRLAVLSNKPHAMTRKVVDHYFPALDFVRVIGAREGHPRKPDPSSALEIARALELDPSKVAYLGDTNTDMQTAERAGMFSIGALWGFRDREELGASGAKALALSPADVVDWIR